MWWKVRSGLGFSAHFIFFLIFILGPNRLQAEKLSCLEMVEAIRREPELYRSHIVKDTKGREFHFGHAQLAKIFRNGLTPEALQSAVEFVMAKRGAELTMSSDGDIFAAPVNGYWAVWTRDGAFIIPGLSIPQQRIALPRFLRVIGHPRNLALFILNIQEPSLHFQDSAGVERMARAHWNPLFEGLPFDASMFVPHIRMTKDELLDPEFFTGNPIRTPSENWNHKQNDAHALSFITAANALRDGIIRWKDLDDSAKAVLPLILAYGIGVQYYNKWDAGAWEEGNGRRTTSIGLFTQALWMFRKNLLRDHFVFHLKQNKWISPDVHKRIDQLLSAESVNAAIASGIRIVKDQLHKGESPDQFDPGDPQGRRHSDAALAHLLYVFPEWLDESDFRIILDHLKNLRRPTGTIRYDGDVYLTMGQFFSPADVIPKELVKDGRHLTAGEIQQAFWTKNSSFVRSVFGADYMARWNIANYIRLMGLVKMIDRFSDSPHLDEYRRELEEEIVTAFTFFTGENAEGLGPYGLDGNRVRSVAITEANVPVSFFRPDGAVDFEARIPSKFTPLGWPTSLFRQSMEVVYEFYRKQGLDFPRDPFHRLSGVERP